MILTQKDKLYHIKGREIESFQRVCKRILVPYLSLFNSYGPFENTNNKSIRDITPPGIPALSVSEKITEYKTRITCFLPRIFIEGESCLIDGRKGSYEKRDLIVEVPRQLIDKVVERIGDYERLKQIVKHNPKNFNFEKHLNGERMEADFGTLLDCLELKGWDISQIRDRYTYYLQQKFSQSFLREEWANNETKRLFAPKSKNWGTDGGCDIF
jgi:hypothetical protein